MGFTGSIALTGQVTTPTGTNQVNPGTFLLAAVIGSVTAVQLASGTNTIAIPTGTTLIVVVPASGNTVALTLKGVAGDTGILMHKTNYFVLTPDSTVTSFVITAASITSGLTYIYFY